MKQVIQVSLNRNPWSIEIDAHARLETYLAEAAAALADNPDRDEILLDLEQAIADQCQRRMPESATVIALLELEPALAEIGPVRPATVQPDKTAAATPAEPAAGTAAVSPPLQQITQGAWASGVCLGLARHFGVEVTLLRVLALLLLFFSGGAALLLYGALMLLLPFAPLDPAQPEPSRIAARLREWTEALRGRIAQLAR